MPTLLSPRVSESLAQTQKQPDGEPFSGLHRQAPKPLWRQAAGKLLLPIANPILPQPAGL
jgi:hypothetical protein